MAFTSGEKWKTIRSWTVKNLKAFGFGKKASTESITKKELTFLKDKINETVEADGILNTNLVFNLSALNVLWTVMAGQRISEKDERIHKLLEDQDACLKSKGLALGMTLLSAYPSLRYCFPELLSYNVSMNFYLGFVKFASEMLHERMETLRHHSSDLSDQSEPSNLLDAYIIQMANEKDSSSKLFTGN
jgi:hypothetical protein